MCLTVSLCVCRVDCLRVYLSNHIYEHHQIFVRMLPVIIARSCSGDVQYVMHFRFVDYVMYSYNWPLLAA